VWRFVLIKLHLINVIRFHLQVLYGISVKNFAKKKGKLVYTGAKVFGVPLENLPRRYIPEFGLVPCFLVDGCSLLLDRVGTVGLFRKPGSLPRVKILREKLNRGDDALSTASPYDIATLVKQFCRELPELLFPSELHVALLKAQGLPNLQDKMAALQLLSCLLPAKNSSLIPKTLMDSMKYFVNFAHLEDVFKKRNQKIRSLKGKIQAIISEKLEFYLIKVAFFFFFSVKRSEKTMLWIQSKPKIRPAVSDPTLVCITRGDSKLRRSIGLETFPNIRLFRTCMPSEGRNDFKMDNASVFVERIINTCL
uniref:Rho-GAP domain-containing protein n=1 Tax=Poecilia reticulata TaxID=8081 RepID=A0A3P9P296_POERE